MDKQKILLISLLAAIPFLAPAQEPSDMRGVGRLNAIEVKGEGRNLLFVIGIDQYKNWFQLKNAVGDARGIQEVFMEQFGFTPILDPLYDEEATRDNIKDRLDEMRKLLKPDDNLVIFFAGHGETRVDTVGDRVIKAGFIIPADGDALSSHRWSSYISIQEFMSEVARLPARHVTLLLDACHSGIALDDDAQQFRGTDSAPPAALVNAVSRRVITSARGDQLANDRGPVGGHSLFTGMLVQGLKNGQADMDGDRFITSTEIGLFLQQSVSSYSGNTQTPDFGVFQLDQRGDMVLRLEANTAGVLANNALSQWKAGKVDDFLETFEKLREVDSTFLDFQILQYYYGLMTKDIELSIHSLKQWEARANQELEAKGKETRLMAVRSATAGLIHWRYFLENPFPITNAIGIDFYLNNRKQTPLPLPGAPLHFRASNDDTLRLEIRNLRDVPTYVYALGLDALGRIRFLNLWDDPGLVFGQGLLPGKSAVTASFTSPLIKGFIAYRLFVSNQPVPAFLVPPDDFAINIKTPEFAAELSIQTVWVTFD